MSKGRNIFGQLVVDNTKPICRACWKGDHHKCRPVLDELNNCECGNWWPTKREHAESVTKGARIRATTGGKHG